MNGNLISALRNMVDDIENLGASPITVDANVLRQAIAAIPTGVPMVSVEAAHEAIRIAHTLPEGYVLVPVEPTEAMIEGFWGKIKHGEHERAAAEDAWRDAIAARPEETP